MFTRWIKQSLLGAILPVLCMGSKSVLAVPMRDIVILMDSSSSLGSSGWNAEKDFVIDLIETVFDDPALDYLGLVRFSNNVIKEWDFLGQQDPRDPLKTHVQNLSFLSGHTSTRSALDAAIEIFEDTGRSDLNDDPTDGTHVYNGSLNSRLSIRRTNFANPGFDS